MLDVNEFKQLKLPVLPTETLKNTSEPTTPWIEELPKLTRGEKDETKLEEEPASPKLETPSEPAELAFTDGIERT